MEEPANPRFWESVPIWDVPFPGGETEAELDAKLERELHLWEPPATADNEVAAEQYAAAVEALLGDALRVRRKTAPKFKRTAYGSSFEDMAVFRLTGAVTPVAAAPPLARLNRQPQRARARAHRAAQLLDGTLKNYLKQKKKNRATTRMLSHSCRGVSKGCAVWTLRLCGDAAKILRKL